MTTVFKKSPSANVTIKLEPSERDRLKSLALAKKRTPHFLMKEAIQSYIEKEELEQRFIQCAEESLRHYRETGSHLTLEEFRTWAKAIKTHPKAPLPPCHK